MERVKCPSCGGRLNDVEFGEWFCADCLRSFLLRDEGFVEAYLSSEGEIHAVPMKDRDVLPEEPKPKKKRGRPPKKNSRWVAEKEAMKVFGVSQKDLEEGRKLSELRAEVRGDELYYSRENLYRFLMKRKEGCLGPGVMCLKEASDYVGVTRKVLREFVRSRRLFYKSVKGESYVDLWEILECQENERALRERVKDLLSVSKAAAQFHHSPDFIRRVLKREKIETISTRWAEYVPEEGIALFESMN